MEEKIVKIVAGKLRNYGSQPINQEKLVAIRAAVYSATKTNKSASFANVKKWIKEARSAMKKQEKERAKAAKAHSKPKKAAERPKKSAERSKPMVTHEPMVSEVSRKVEDSVNLIKENSSTSPQIPSQEVLLPKPIIVFDKIYLQSIKFEIAGIRQTMERVSRQLDKLEKELTNHSD